MSSDRNISGSELGLMICNALSIDPDGVIEVSIRMVPNEPAAVSVVRHVTKAKASAITQSVAMYELRRVGI